MAKKTFLDKNGTKITLLFFGMYLVSSLAAQASITSRIGGNLAANLMKMLVVASLFALAWYLLLRVHTFTKAYSATIRGSAEEPAFTAISRATLLLYISLLITAFVNVLRFPQSGSGLHGILTITVYYSAGWLAAAYCYQFGTAGRVFARYVRKRKRHLAAAVLATITLGSLGLMAWLRVAGQTSYSADHILSYVSKPIVLITLFIPLVMGWIYALSGAYGIYLYQRYGEGVVYKKSMNWLSAGTVILVVVSLSRHITDYLFGSPTQASLATDFTRVLILLLIVDASIFSMRRGVSLLTRIEKTK